jgi:Phosphate-selective porin O and P
LTKRKKTYAICGALGLFLLCRPSLAMHLGRLRKTPGCCNPAIKSRLPVKGTASSREKSTSHETATSPPAACHACPTSRVENREGESDHPNYGETARTGCRSKRGLEAGWNRYHFYIRKARRFEVDPNGYFQFTYRGHAGPAAPNNDFVLRRAVLGARGTIGGLYDFDISAEISDRKTPLHSADLQVNYKQFFQLKLGRFKEPCSREELVSSRYREFAERAMINNLVPGDGLGAMAQGDFFRRAPQYQTGIFGGKGILGEKDSITPDGVFRLRLTPWLRSRSRYLRGMVFGSAFADGRTSHGESFEGSTASGSFAFFEQEPVNGGVTRANGEWTCLIGPAGYHPEYIQSRQDLQGLSPEEGNLPGVIAKGYY